MQRHEHDREIGRQNRRYEIIPASQAVRYASQYRLTDQTPASRCVDALFTLFATDIAALLIERDATIEAWRCTHTGDDALEDRALDITSSRVIDIIAVLAEVQNMVDFKESYTNPCVQ